MEIKLLVKQAKKGDREALLKLVMYQQADYYKLAYVYMKKEEDALDALQDMIITLYENISKLRKEESFYSWSKTILVNTCRKKLKASNKLIYLEELEEVTIDERYSESEDRILLESHMNALSDIHQEVIRLRYFLDLDYETISELLNIPLGTVKSRLNAGLSKLKESMGGKLYE